MDYFTAANRADHDNTRIDEVKSSVVEANNNNDAVDSKFLQDNIGDQNDGDHADGDDEEDDKEDDDRDDEDREANDNDHYDDDGDENDGNNTSEVDDTSTTHPVVIDGVLEES